MKTRHGIKKFWIHLVVLSPLFATQQILPLIAAAVVAAGAQLIGGLMNNANSNEQQKQKDLQDAQNRGYQAMEQGAQDVGSSAQTAFGQMMNGYRSALIR